MRAWLALLLGVLVLHAAFVKGVDRDQDGKDDDEDNENGSGNDENGDDDTEGGAGLLVPGVPLVFLSTGVALRVIG